MNSLTRSVLETALTRGAAVTLAMVPHSAGIAGKRLGRHTGNALEFAEYREYQPGDDLRRLDWSVYARSEQLMVKLFREEIDPRCDLILDHSASMAAGSGEKGAVALGLAGLLAVAAVRSGFSLTVWHCGEQLTREAAPGQPLQWRDTSFESVVGPGETLAEFPPAFQARGVRFLVSDLLFPQAPATVLPYLTRGAGRMVVLQLLSREERNSVERGNRRLIDAETGEERELVLEEAVLMRYRQRLAYHQEAWRNAARENGAELISLTVEELYPGWNLQELFRCGVLQ